MEFRIFHKKIGEELSDMVLSKLGQYKNPFSDCRGQGCNNGTNMFGKIKGA